MDLVFTRWIMAITKNNYYEGKVVDYTHEGLGVVKVDGYPVFIQDALLNESIRFKAIKVNSKFGYGKLIDIINKSENRIEPPCPYYFQCGGCQIQSMSYEEQLKFKRIVVKNNMRRLGTDLIIHPTVGDNDGKYYRNKSQIPVQMRNGKLEMGFYRERSHDLIDIDHCLIQKDIHNALMLRTKELIESENITIYDEKKHSGLLRHVIIRSSHDNEEIQIAFVTNGKENVFRNIANTLAQEYPNIKSIVQNINDRKTNVIMGRENKVLYGEPYIVDTLLGKHFKIRTNSFYQVNHRQTEKLYQLAIDAAELKGDEVIVDTYCGIGTIGLSVADKVKQLIGIEIVESAVIDARENAKLNNVENATFYQGASEVIMKELVAEGIKPDVVFVDPPRKGCHSDFLDSLIEVSPEKIVYVSCNPSTLARDMKYLMEHGYTAKEVRPLDMFPQTNHVETVCLLTRK